jgi:hypothetical protein
VTASIRDRLLPALYNGGLASLFDRPAPVETRATCSDCPMCKDPAAWHEPGPRSIPAARFRSDIKCCTWYPDLPNYHVGAALSDESPGFAEGRRRLRAQIAARAGVTPLGVGPPPAYSALYDFLVAAEPSTEVSFGRNEALVCPYFDRSGGSCTVWAYRERVCATYFCKHDARAAGYATWMAISRYLDHLQTTLARHAARSVLESAGGIDEVPRWGAYDGREEEFFMASFQFVRATSPDQLAELVDDEVGRALLAKAEARYDDLMSPKLHRRLTLVSDDRTVAEQGGRAVFTYSRFDPVFVPDALFEGLAAASGVDADELVARLRSEHGLVVSKDDLQKLQLYGVLKKDEEG